MVQGTVAESYVVDTLHLQPVKYPGFATLYASLKTRQIDAWVAPRNSGVDRDPTGRPGGDCREHFQRQAISWPMRSPKTTSRWSMR